jgi:hypothetical protein
MNNIKEIIDRYALRTNRYTLKKGITIVDTDDGRFVFKKNNGNNIANLYKYLNSRNFTNYDPLVNSDDHYNVYHYIDEIDTPKEQKALDLVNIISLLHNKTTFYKEVDIDDYKKIYEDIKEKLNYYYSYYSNLIDMIETKVYMSPAEYLLARHISKVFGLFYYCQKELEDWYNLIKDKKKQRFVTLHNNLEIDHLIKTDETYLISWENSKVDMPIYDLINLYEKHYFNLDFAELLKSYEFKYPLLPEERKLFFILISIPKKVEFTNNHYLNCKEVNRYLDYIYTTEEFILEYQSQNKPE